MERRKSPIGRGRPAKSRPAVNIATTALGAEPEKRGLKKSSSKPFAGKNAAKAGPSGGGQRDMAVALKTAAKRKLSSQLWLTRQLNDPYVARSKAEGYRSRAAYKLKELDDKFALLKKEARIVDLGSAPGGWLQVCVEKGGAPVIGIDYLATAPVAGAEIIEMDFLEAEAPARLKSALGGAADLVLSDMAAPTTGHKATDHLRVVALAEAALDFAIDVLAPGGSFVCKVFQGGTEGELLARLKAIFTSVKHAKPRASRAESAEIYVVATGFRGGRQ
jgi:23S rRNA (uridine2552-2'-O)-methyltransferase